MNIIDEKKISRILEKDERHDLSRVKEITGKARSLKGLTLEETSYLLKCDDGAAIKEIFLAARDVKTAIYGNRIVLFAPLYLSNFCRNNCLYCAFRSDNKELKRTAVTMEELKKEVEALEDQGHKRLLLVAGEDTELSGIDYLEKAVKTVYSVKKGKGSIRRVNVNVAPLSDKDFKRLKATGIGTYQLFQETYHRPTYKKVHPAGAKADYEGRLGTMDRAMRAGIDDVGIGALFGLYDHRFEVLALLSHAMHLEKWHGAGPHTISVPRLRTAMNAPLSDHVPHPVSDLDFKKIVSILRLAVPYTGIILSTREAPLLRDELLSLGVSQMSAGSKTDPGGYSKAEGEGGDSGQFHLEDNRPQKEIIAHIIEQGFLPSFCTACYRAGRTGHDFMELAKPGDIKDFCLPNCILTFKEYVLDYGDSGLREAADSIIEREVDKISAEEMKVLTRAKLKELEGGSRDVYF